MWRWQNEARFHRTAACGQLLLNPNMLHHATPCYTKFHQITKYATLCNIMQLAKGGKNYCAGNLTHASVGKSSEFDSRVQTISLRTWRYALLAFGVWFVHRSVLPVQKSKGYQFIRFLTTTQLLYLAGKYRSDVFCLLRFMVGLSSPLRKTRDDPSHLGDSWIHFCKHAVSTPVSSGLFGQCHKSLWPDRLREHFGKPTVSWAQFQEWHGEIWFGSGTAWQLFGQSDTFQD